MKVKKFEILSFAIIFLFVIIGIVLSHTNLDFFNNFYVGEDRLLEWLSVLGLAFGSIICFHRASILKPFRNGYFIGFLYFLGFLFIFGAGEEISWGQRIFGWKSPEFFALNNSQGETNLHNLVAGGVKINKLIFGTILGIIIVIYFIALPMLYTKLEKFRNKIDFIGIPVPKFFHVGAYILLAILAELIAGHKKGEILEFGGIWIFVIMLIEPLNRPIFSRVSESR